MKKKKDVYYFIAHIDDFEISCLSHLEKFCNEYNKINIFIACKWHKKEKIWSKNLELIQNFFNIRINYHNFLFNQRTLMSNVDDLKDKFYKMIDFKNNFDLVSHDKEDNHTDHFACNLIARGMFKYSSRFITIYSPSSTNFKPNCWITLSDSLYNLKKTCVDKYNIDNEQSYSKLGYYLQSEEHYNLGRAFYLENFTCKNNKHYEIYNFQKQVY
tara:strand:+ start:12967 stop:13608 length:642 start_codon:yes stop_codon:yes gene_type:complete